MNKLITFIAVAALCTMAFVSVEAASPFQFSTRLRAEYDDNIYETETNEEDSFKFIAEVGVLYNLNLDGTIFSIYYAPSFVWWDNRDTDDTDLHHTFDAVLKHRFSPRVGVDFKNTLRVAERPELIERGAVIRENNDYLYNSANAGMDFMVSPKNYLDVEGRYVILRYDEGDVADRRDYDLIVAGAGLRREFSERNSSSLQFRYEEIDYEGPDRGSESIQVGVLVEQTFNPQLLGTCRLGYQMKDYNAAVSDDDTAPYASASLTYLPVPKTRITASAGYSLYETELDGYVNQERTSLSLGMSHEITPKLAAHLVGYYTIGSYDNEDVVDDGAFVGTDGDENVIQISARATYKIQKNNWIEAGWQYTDLDSDLRSDFQRNRINLGWTLRI